MRYQDMPKEERALVFPTRFPIKAMGKIDHNIRFVLINLLEQYQVQFSDHDINETVSKNGKYLSVTVYITAESRVQLDTIYEGLQACPEVMVTL